MPASRTLLAAFRAPPLGLFPTRQSINHVSRQHLSTIRYLTPKKSLYLSTVSSSFTPTTITVVPRFSVSYVPYHNLVTMSSNNKTDEKDATVTTTTTITKPLNVSSSVNSRLTLLYDGECPLCVKEVNMLRSRSDVRGGTLTFVDIASDEFDDDTFGVDYETAMGRIHAVKRDGSVIEGIQVFREAYEAVGLGWVYSIAKIPGLLWLANRVYDIWADRRLQFTGRDTLEAIVKARNERRSCR